MANVYVRSGAGGAGTGADWANAYTTLAAAFAAKAAGDDFWVSDDHAESTAGAVTLTPPGTAASPNRVVCVNHLGSVPPVSADLRTTATVVTTGANNLTIGAGTAYWYGINFTASSGGNTGTPIMNVATATGVYSHFFEACQIENGNTNGGNINIGPSGLLRDTSVVFFNTKVKFNRAGAGINALGVPFRWENTASAIAGTAPTTLFTLSPVTGSNLIMRGVDISAIGSGTFMALGSLDTVGHAYLEDCRLGSGMALTSGSWPGQGSQGIRLVNCNSGNTNYSYRLSNYMGDIYDEETVVRTGGATDGTTPVSRKMVSTANSKFYAPLVSDWLLVWNNVTGSAITVNVPIITDNVTLTNAQAWIEVEYLGNASYPLSTIDVSSRAADVLATGTNQPTDTTSSWASGSLGTPVLQYLTASITPALKGFIRVRVCLAKASTTMYFDPAPVMASWAKYGGVSYMAGESGMSETFPTPINSLILPNTSVY